MQYFIGLKEYSFEAPFDPSLLVYFRKRFRMNEINAINEKIFKKSNEDRNDDPPQTGGPGTEGKKKTKNKGKLIIDAICAPADIRYSTNLNLLNEAGKRQK